MKVTDPNEKIKNFQDLKNNWEETRLAIKFRFVQAREWKEGAKDILNGLDRMIKEVNDPERFKCKNLFPLF